MVERKVLAVDDDPAALEAIVALLKKDGYEVHTAASAEAAKELLARFDYSLIITDLVLPGQSGIELVRHAAAHQPQAISIVVTGHATLRSAIDALKAGAWDYLTKPLDPEHLRDLAARAIETKTKSLAVDRLDRSLAELDGMVTRNPAMRAVFDKVLLAAQTESVVLLQGESGTGKELCARSIHARSRRATKGFVVFPAGASPPERALEELFGVEDERGTRPGKVALARGGTLLLEEIDALDARAQTALLTLLERGTYRPVHGAEERVADVRLLASTHRNLAELVRDGRFREDLYYRISIFPIEIPPLRERREDVPVLVDRFLGTFAARYARPRPTLPPETLERLLRYDWPGNVRELQNVIEHAVILCTDGVLSPSLLPRMLQDEPAPAESIQIPIGTRMKEIERAVIARTLDAFHWNKNKTAKILGISRRSLYNKLDRYRITREKSREAPRPREGEGAAGASLAEGKR